MTPKCDVPFLTWGLLRAWKSLTTLTRRVANLICTFLSNLSADRVDARVDRESEPLLQDHGPATSRDRSRPISSEAIIFPASSRVSAARSGIVPDIFDETIHELPSGPSALIPKVSGSSSTSTLPTVHDHTPSPRGERTGLAIVDQTTKIPPALVMKGPAEPPIEPLSNEQLPAIYTFNQPYGFVIRDSTFVAPPSDVSHNNTRKEERAAMELLEKKRTAGAEVNSYERYPPPKCHPETRKTTRGSITRWLEDVNRVSNMYWLLGSAGVGKSAIAQTIAEEAQRAGRLGGTFFFSRPNGRDDPLTVIPTLVHQLVVRFPSYKQIIARVLAKDSTIFEKGLETQFRLLIVQPFQDLQRSQPFIHPILVVLDGLDECRSEDAQASFIQLINGCSTENNVPLSWLVCSRDEWHLKRLLPERDPTIRCVCDKLLVDGIEGRDDVYRFICDEFSEIRKRFCDEVDETWPEESDVVEFAGASSGQFAFASTAMRFIGSNEPGDPASQLEACLSAIRKAPRAGDTNPFHALDLLYVHIFSSIPTIALPNAMRIISLHLLIGHDSHLGHGTAIEPEAGTPWDSLLRHEPLYLPALGTTLPAHGTNFAACANILHLSKAMMYSALRRLHSVISIPTVQEAHVKPLRIYHASLTDFLRDPGRSGRLHDQLNQGHFESVMQMLKWTNFLSPRCHARNCPCNNIQKMSLTWSSSSLKDRRMIENIEHLCKNVWKGLYRPPMNEFLPFLGWVENKQNHGQSLLRRGRYFPSDTCYPDQSFLYEAPGKYFGYAESGPLVGSPTHACDEPQQRLSTWPFAVGAEGRARIVVMTLLDTPGQRIPVRVARTPKPLPPLLEYNTWPRPIEKKILDLIAGGKLPGSISASRLTVMGVCCVLSSSTMVKRPKSPKPIEDSKFLTVVHPFPLNANMEVPNDFKDFMYWLASVVGTEYALGVYHKPSARGMVVAEVSKTFSEFEVLLGEHSWNRFLQKPTMEEKERKTRVYYSTYSTARDLQKDGWKNILADDALFSDYRPINRPVACAHATMELTPL
ncbi:hypothetical protein NP233_g3549 [Leucocoprinus birnbaumii]|uniref:Nephrocystin 3-like N-terminal domain-containing protein n=1 Tax=Leucocoprinus birnbaumii TaxID=56174 RepID=A0AAD5W2W0_9AGAR|nr:hypothetical protein NP233_g3549 [Leucocoprinus birnbaumii]